MSIEKLRPAENLSQVDKIEMGSQEYLRTENFQPGDALPKEIELAEAMGVSRTALRDLLNTLKHGHPELFKSQMRTHLMVYFKKLSVD